MILDAPVQPKPAALDGMLDRAAALKPTFAAQHDQTDQARRVSDDAVEALRQTGMFKLLQPKRFGGFEADYDLFSAMVEEVAGACASTAWVASVLTEHAWAIGCFPEAAQEDVWGSNPDAIASSSLSPKAVKAVDGGFLVDGTWQFSSGCDHADWVMIGGAYVDAEGGSQIRYLLIPKADVQIVDDWRVLGLRGTGSKSLKFDNVFVPMHRSVPFPALITGATPGAALYPDSYLYRAPRSWLATYTFTPIILALAQKGLELVVERLSGRVTRGVRVADQEAVQIKIAVSAAEIDLARLRMHAGVRENVALLRRGGTPTREQTLANSRDIAYLVKLLRTAMERLCEAQGSGYIYDDDPVQSVLRDLVTASTHRIANWELSMIPYGKLRLGVG